MIIKKELNIKLTERETYIWKEFEKLINSIEFGLRQEGEDELAYDIIPFIENGMGDLEIYIDFFEERK